MTLTVVLGTSFLSIGIIWVNPLCRLLKWFNSILLSNHQSILLLQGLGQQYIFLHGLPLLHPFLSWIGYYNNCGHFWQLQSVTMLFLTSHQVIRQNRVRQSQIFHRVWSVSKRSLVCLPSQAKDLFSMFTKPSLPFHSCSEVEHARPCTVDVAHRCLCSNVEFLWTTICVFVSMFVR